MTASTGAMIRDSSYQIGPTFWLEKGRSKWIMSIPHTHFKPHTFLLEIRLSIQASLVKIGQGQEGSFEKHQAITVLHCTLGVTGN